MRFNYLFIHFLSFYFHILSVDILRNLYLIYCPILNNDVLPDGSVYTVK